MTTFANSGFYTTVRDHDRHAAMETIRQLLEQTESLATDADLAEVAFLIGVALAALRPEGHNGGDHDPDFGTSSRIM